MNLIYQHPHHHFNFERILKIIFQILPFPSALKIKLKNTFFYFFREQAKNFTSYKIWRETNISIKNAVVNNPTLIYPTPQLTTDFGFFTPLKPTVSIIIAVFNKIEYTLQCLRSIALWPCRISYEIIIIDNASTDKTSEILHEIPGIKYFPSNTNLGFILGCNFGASKARGDYLLFLNNDTLVLPGWLDHLVETFNLIPETGLAGSKLIYPDGQLQEAGCYISRLGEVWGYGKSDDPGLPEYNYLREVDYCSGASILIPNKLFVQIGGFDEKYLPAYCEDSDLALKVKSLGKKVIYQPRSEVIHFEGTTSNDQFEKFYHIKYRNLAIFAECWREKLKEHGELGDQTRVNNSEYSNLT